jgi:hypothetical protein
MLHVLHVEVKVDHPRLKLLHHVGVPLSARTIHTSCGSAYASRSPNSGSRCVQSHSLVRTDG